MNRIVAALFAAFTIIVSGCGEKPIDLRSDSTESKQTTALASTPVGMPIEINDVIIPGGELEAIANRGNEDSDLPVVLRVAQAIPHGDDFRYRFVFYGLDPGEYDLGDYLEPVSGDEPRDLPSIKVTVTTMLPEGQIEPNRLQQGDLPKVGGYEKALWAFGIVWMFVLLSLLFGVRRKRIATAQQMEQPVTFADRLRPLVQAATTGDLDVNQQAEHELLLLSYWKKRLGVSDLSPAKAMASLRNHDEAGELIRHLEEWLHSPNPPVNVDVERLLAKYRHVPDDSDTPVRFSADPSAFDNAAEIVDAIQVETESKEITTG